MKTINRTIAVVKPQQPFLDWIHSIKNDQNDQNDEITLDELQDDCSTYLLPEADMPSDCQGMIEEMYEDIFEEELFAWYVDDSLWPAQRDLDTFQSWFVIEIHSVVYDLSDSPILHDE